MKYNIDVFWGLDRPREQEDFLLNTARTVLEREGIESGELSIALVDDGKMQDLNREYRNCNATTDVLSFPLGEDQLGEIIISWPRVEEQARDYGHSLERELGFLLVHGILHLLGYDHQQEEETRTMRRKEDEVLSYLKLEREGEGDGG